MLKFSFMAAAFAVFGSMASAETPVDPMIAAHFDSMRDAEQIAGWERSGVLRGHDLIGVRSGGNGCPVTFQWATVSKGEMRISDPFGTCAYPESVTNDGDVLIVTMPSLNPNLGDIRFLYDGEGVVEQMAGLKSSGVSDLSAWEGKTVYDYMTDSANEAPLISLMGWENLEQARLSSVVGSGAMVRDGNWVTGSACRPHMCGESSMALAVNVKSGEAIIALKVYPSSARLFGEPSEAMPSEVRSILTQP